jgi:hypothetical protein
MGKPGGAASAMGEGRFWVWQGLQAGSRRHWQAVCAAGAGVMFRAGCAG